MRSLWSWGPVLLLVGILGWWGDAVTAFPVQVPSARRHCCRSTCRMGNHLDENRETDDPPRVPVAHDDSNNSIPRIQFNNNDDDDRTAQWSRLLRGVARTGLKEASDLQVGDVVVAKADVPQSQIWRDTGYEIVDWYWQGFNATTGQVERISARQIQQENGTVPSGRYTQYLKVYAPQYHSEPVIVTPTEMGLTTLKSELVESLWLAIPGFFWVFVASSFANYYTDKYGGTFWDAFFRT